MQNIGALQDSLTVGSNQQQSSLEHTGLLWSNFNVSLF